ncbi:MAG: hypothetical protein ABMA64_21665 [Myxococcota bacterium]
MSTGGRWMGGLAWLASVEASGAEPAASSDAVVQEFADLGLAVAVPEGFSVTSDGYDLIVTLSSGYGFRVVNGDAAGRIAARKAWLTDSDRTEVAVLVDEPLVFLYSAQEGSLPDVSFVAGATVGRRAWYAETNGAIVEIRTQLAPTDQAEVDRLLAAAAAAGSLHGPEADALVDPIVALRAEAPQERVVTSMTVDECRAAIALVTSLQPAASRRRSHRRR